jgi:hypothetical protein
LGPGHALGGTAGAGVSLALRRDLADATSVHVAFFEIDARTTRVEIEHSGWERIGERGPGLRNANQAGWSGLWPHFCEAAGFSVDKETK